MVLVRVEPALVVGEQIADEQMYLYEFLWWPIDTPKKVFTQEGSCFYNDQAFSTLHTSSQIILVKMQTRSKRNASRTNVSLP